MTVNVNMSDEKSNLRSLESSSTVSRPLREEVKVHVMSLDNTGGMSLEMVKTILKSSPRRASVSCASADTMGGAMYGKNKH